ncbi:Hydroxyacid oxidase 1 [Galdieria sulphuraria]|uniref:(S)-2-hydroxy-acid oxidase n=1 Tax=Galdieria sulphuraria TaxID=130081 RepID=M2Y0E7_GALSU|nr:(S)-2-hydroxy-acid oxidase [Galdieria sulphuraria]EME29309.1 (S)-2-hydroxy-acid oxidase [Galdieria sulphuraria]GJD05876.1 Hydroxyacid oxidase 1 [Galdieria sulphuraria]|eukprot:XP_005705829.1 (S)-2-hydroxy-acid oxidase [Galdieria sulphuraria]
MTVDSNRNAQSQCLVLKDFELEAKRKLPKHIYEYVASGAGDEQSVKANTRIFQTLFIIPRVLSSCSEPKTSLQVGKTTLSFPFLVAPFGVHKLVHPQGEEATALACLDEGITLGVSQHATVRLEQVRKVATKGSHWFQCYILKDRDITLRLVKRAEEAGYEALVITVDSPIFGYRPIDTRNGFQRLPSGLNYENYSDEDKKIYAFANEGDTGGFDDHIDKIFDANITWDDVRLIRQQTRLPVFLKGIQSVEDALLAYKYGLTGIIISNHGGRQLGSAVPTLQCLPAVVQAVRKLKLQNFPILIDSGFRSGEDIIKALALGADAVCIGRPILWGLACNGILGVKKVLGILKREFIDGMKLSGCSCLEDIHKLKLISRGKLATKRRNNAPHIRNGKFCKL